MGLHPYQFEQYAGDENTGGLEHMTKNLEMRRSMADKTFTNRSGRLIGIRFIRPSEQKKHFIASWSQDQATAESRKRTSPHGVALGAARR